MDLPANPCFMILTKKNTDVGLKEVLAEGLPAGIPQGHTKMTKLMRETAIFSCRSRAVPWLPNAQTPGAVVWLLAMTTQHTAKEMRFFLHRSDLKHTRSWEEGYAALEHYQQ